MVQVRESDGMANGTNKVGKGCNPPTQTKAPQVEEGEGAAAKTNQGGKGGKIPLYPPRITKPVAIPPQGWPPP